MADPKRNAAIYYQPEGFKPGKALNGQRMAGASFLKGFFANADVDVFFAVADTPNKLKDFVDQAHQYSCKKPVRGILNDCIEELLPVSSVFISTPNYHSWAWQRLHFGMEAYSLCGPTNTISTTAVIEGVHNLRVSPQAEWDAIICRSKAG
jgi:hypothetical protein